MTDKLRLDDFDYPLDEQKIAQHPPDRRDGAKMLVVDKKSGALQHASFTDFPAALRENDLVILNDTRVLPARLIGHRPGKEERVELLLLHRTDGKNQWECLGKPGKKLREGSVVKFGDALEAVVERITEEGNRIVSFRYEGIWEEVLEALGEMPLPPYIHESLADRTRYQTVYAARDGSAAAPTAGLHFTDETFSAIRARGVRIEPLTLHVGLGTFRPVKTDNLDEHPMHSEWYHLPQSTVEAIRETRARGGRVIAIGTTSLRVLETVGAEIFAGPPKARTGWTDLFIRPGFQFQVVDVLLTNFHLPKSTLLMLVSAFSSREIILNAYREADARDYRFFSFGDCMLLEENPDEIHTA